MLSPVRKISAKEAVIASLENFIAENGLKEGNPLPTELELSRRLKVSRSVLREGLQYFRTLGIIGTRPKRGAYIKRLSPKNPFGGYLTFMRGDKRKIREIGQMRMAIELGIIPFLMERVSDKDLEELNSIASKMRASTHFERCELDVRFHSYLLRIVGNELMNGLIPLIVDFFEDNTPTEFKGKNAEEISTEHLDFVKALRNKNSELLSRFVRSHYSNYLQE